MATIATVLCVVRQKRALGKETDFPIETERAVSEVRAVGGGHFVRETDCVFWEVLGTKKWLRFGRDRKYSVRPSHKRRTRE